MTMLLRPDVQAYPWPLAIGIALLITTAIGLSTGLLVTKAGVPSFVVTLAGLLIWSGVVLTLTTQSSTSGTIRIQDETVIDIAGAFLSDAQGWILGILSVALFAAVELPDGIPPSSEGPGRPSRSSSCCSRSPGWPPSWRGPSGTPTATGACPSSW